MGQEIAAQTKGDVLQEAEGQQETRTTVVGWGEKIEEHCQKIKQHAETYPYVWGSYILVYGRFGLWLTYRWRKLYRTEDRVRGLQERLRNLVEAEQSINTAALTEQSTNSTSDTNKAPSPADKVI
ncbi:uncharacterized protein LOC111401626 [Olea europaea subsp. europaea]|uniref:Uncharacterized protein LOC111401626 n=1 Tax=Olea europaea subsp. europaea TaxID=158383 RepID=A0A8S0T865_OLEEU|nr:uncharacterized protein LOC111401626 [Olea europaea subsp. europaea]